MTTTAATQAPSHTAFACGAAARIAAIITIAAGAALAIAGAAT